MAVMHALQAGADPSAKDEHGHTPAKVAAMHGHRAVVEALLRRSGDSGSGSGGEAAGSSSSSAGVDAFMASSKADLKEREEKVGKLAGLRCIEWAGGSVEGGHQVSLSAWQGSGKSGRCQRNGQGSHSFLSAAAAHRPLHPHPQASSSGGGSGDGASVIAIPSPEVPDEALADTFKRKGNEFFVAGDYEGAAKLYELSLSHWTQ